MCVYVAVRPLTSNTHECLPCVLLLLLVGVVAMCVRAVVR